MPFDSPPFAMDSTTQDAALFRRAIGTLIAPAGGIVSPGDLAVTQQATPNMSVQIGTGQIWIPGTSLATQGPYYARNSAPVTQPISTASASLPRVDTILAQIVDQAYAGSGYTCAPGYVMGTPAAGATLANLTGVGAVPASSLTLAYVLVPAGATSIVTADIANVVAAMKVVNAGTPARAYRTAAIASLPAGASKIPLDTLSFDPAGCFDVVTNHRYNVLAPGYYLVTCQVAGQFNTNTTSEFLCWLYKNGTAVSQGGRSSSTTATGGSGVVNSTLSDLVQCVAGDYLELWCNVASGGAVSLSASGAQSNYLAVTRIA